MKTDGKTRTINVEYLARIEGEAGLFLRLKGDRVADLKLKVFEPPRFFEGILRGRHFTEAPDITARICGICPIAYQMGAVHAMEDICGVTVGGALRELRRLLYCGEWIESHVLHIYMLHAPDFLGYPDAIQMARDHLPAVQRALRMKKIGNQIMTLLGGREIHPINVRVGGFYRVPTGAQLQDMLPDLRWGLQAAQETVRFAASLKFEDFEPENEFIGLRHPTEYPLNEGRLASTCGIDIPISSYDDILIEEHLPHSTALQSSVKGRDACMAGPLARLVLNFDRLTPLARRAAEEVGLTPACRNPFKSIIVRAVEVVFAFEESIRIIESYQQPASPAVDVTPRAGTGYGCTEAPRGICYHRYTIDDAGLIQDCKIVSPTALNQRNIEHDLRRFVEPRITWSDSFLQTACEKAVRNYDPCISCSAHFLKLHIERT